MTDNALVLLVEDFSDLREATASLLEAWNFSVRQAADGKQALSALRSMTQQGLYPKVIITDLMMPVMNGWEFMKKLQQDPIFASIPIIVMTGTDQDCTSCNTANVLAVLHKPVTFSDIAPHLERLGLCAA